MSLRLLPWAVFAAIVAALAFLAPSPVEIAPASAGTRGTRLSGLEVRLGPVDMREFQENGAWNRLVAAEATYSYGRKTVTGTDVEISLGAGTRPDGAGGSVLRASRAFWDFNGKRIDLPEGGRAAREGGWKGEFAPAVLDLDTRLLRVPGEVRLSGPGVSVIGGNLRWRWPDGKIAMDSPVSRLVPASLPGKRG